MFSFSTALTQGEKIVKARHVINLFITRLAIVKAMVSLTAFMKNKEYDLQAVME